VVSDGVITITDPTPESQRKLGLLGKLFAPLMRDERDMPFIRLTLFLTVVFAGSAIYMFIPGNFRWWMAPIYWGLYIIFLGPFILMLHNVCHNALFKRQYNLLNKYIPWALGIFLGQSPESYFVHHIGMHHAEGNLPNDLSSTMKYQRDSFIDWCKYAGRFLLFGDFDLYTYMRNRKRHRLARLLVLGEMSFFGLAIAALIWNWRAGLVVFVVPMLATRLLLMAGNWAQHAFVDPEDSTNDYRTVITFINSPYNKRCFNDGYHLGHHLKPNRHWLDMPADFLDKREEMIRERSLVFRKIDYFMIYLLLMFKRHKTLARFFVNLDPDNPLPEDEVVALIKRRLKKFDEEQLAAYRAAA
jgi:fatty acid desaturase